MNTTSTRQSFARRIRITLIAAAGIATFAAATGAGTASADGIDDLSPAPTTTIILDDKQGPNTTIPGDPEPQPDGPIIAIPDPTLPPDGPIIAIPDPTLPPDLDKLAIPEPTLPPDLDKLAIPKPTEPTNPGDLVQPEFPANPDDGADVPQDSSGEDSADQAGPQTPADQTPADQGGQQSEGPVATNGTELPSTGTETNIMIAIAAALSALGATTIIASRRKHTA